VKRGHWSRPIEADDAGEGTPGGSDAVLSALSRALDGQSADAGTLFIERQRLAGRSNIYIVRGRTPARQHLRWVVKQPHTGWSQDDVDNPLSAQEEFMSLQRLDAHFKRMDGAFRVPAPVAVLPEIDAFAMEYVSGPTVKNLLNYGSVARPRTLLVGLTAAGTFLRQMHALEALSPGEVDLRAEADSVLVVAEEKLRPLGLSLPDRLRSTLLQFPTLRVTSPRVRLHGDFGPANILLTADGSTVGLDASLSSIGYPEEDLVRFVVLVSGVIRLAPETVAPPVARVRRRLENQLLHAYYQAPVRPLLFELRYLHQLARRWVRLRELSQQGKRRGLLRARLGVIGMQMRLLMADTERRLVHSLEG